MQGKESPPLRRSQPGRLRAGHGACPSRGPALRAAITCLPGRGMRAACGRVSSPATASACAGCSSRGSPRTAQVHLGHLLPGPARRPLGLPEPPQGRVGAGWSPGAAAWVGLAAGRGLTVAGPGGTAGEVGQRPGRSAAPPAQGRPCWAGRRRGEGARAGGWLRLAAWAGDRRSWGWGRGP